MKKVFGLLPLIVSCAGPAVWSSPPASPSPSSGASAATAVANPAAAAPAMKRTPLEIHWSRNSAEHRAAFLQAYRQATEQLRILARGKTAGRWAVILDADETTIDNSTYQKRRADLDSAFSEVTWNAWATERAATALPGALEFTRTVRDLGGKVVIVTNRASSVCGATRDNILAVGIPVDMVLCKPDGPSDKNPRFRAVQAGTAPSTLPALQVLMWVGDNILDFPMLSQAARDSTGVFGDFGRQFIILPNPMYGSWERNNYR